MSKLIPIQVAEQDMLSIQPRFDALNVHKAVVFEQEFEFAMQLLSANKTLAEAAASKRQAFCDAILNVASIGLSLNPAKKEAYLVPRKAQGGGLAVCLDISYRGLTNLATSSGSILWAQANLVHENDRFIMRQFGESPIHEFDPRQNRGDWIGAYCVAKTRDGSFLVEFMDRDEIYRIRDRSDAWQAYLAQKIKSTPWATDEGEMAKKTVSKRGSKRWPAAPRLDQAVHYLNTVGGEGLVDIHQGEESPTQGQTPVDEKQQLLHAIEAATTRQELLVAKQHAQTVASQKRDAKLYDEVTAAAKARRQVLKQQDAVTDVEHRAVA